MNAYVTCVLLLLAAGDENRGSGPPTHDEERSGELCRSERHCERAGRRGGRYERGVSSDRATVCRACFRD
jgi:hypothetical protein